jgi:spore maturation protein CgeB
MNFVLFCHSLLSDWNHGNAHFLRGVATELVARGHTVRVWEPLGNWSLQNLKQEPRGEEALRLFDETYPLLSNVSHSYDAEDFDVGAMTEGADAVIVHEWSGPALVAELGRARRGAAWKLLFHDTHHRAASAPHEMAEFDLSAYDGVLAFGNVVRDIYRERGWARRAWTWHEAADTRVFKPAADASTGASTGGGDLIWVGNWGDGERTRELHEYLLAPARELQLKARVHGVRYPEHALDALRESNIEFGGWLPNVLAPREFAKFKFTIHVPRGPYVQALPGIPTIRPFEALACGLPLICAPWNDVENLFEPGRDFLTARDGAEMKRHAQVLATDAGARRELAAHGLKTVLARHTCAHRVDELMGILGEV